MKDRSDDPSHHERTLLPRSNISLRCVCWNEQWMNYVFVCTYVSFASVVLPKIIIIVITIIIIFVLLLLLLLLVCVCIFDSLCQNVGGDYFFILFVCLFVCLCIYICVCVCMYYLYIYLYMYLFMYLFIYIYYTIVIPDSAPRLV